MEGIRLNLSSSTLFAVIARAVVNLTLVSSLPLACAVQIPACVAQAPELNGDALNAHLKAQLELLDSPQFRARELATWRLAQHAAVVIPLIADSAPTASINSASQQIALLDGFLTNPDTSIKADAFDLLKKLSLSKTGAIAGLAASSVKGIEDDYEMQAYEVLTGAGATIGNLDIAVNGSLAGRARFDGLEIKQGAFTGDDTTLSWIRYLKSIELVALEGDVITAELLALVAQMPGLKKILLRGRFVRPGVYSPVIQPKDLMVFQQVPAIEHFEVNYMPIDDAFVPILCQLPITESIRLFGTAISPSGKDEIAKRLDGLDIYRGNGGFLGISSATIGAVVVNQITQNGAAENAGIQQGDIITEIQGENIKNFAALRKTIAGYAPGEMLVVKLKRPKYNSANRQPEGYFELELFVVLNEQVN